MIMTVMTASAEAGFELKVGTSEHGTIAFKVDGKTAEYADEGDVVTVEITPATGYVVDKPSGQWYAATAASRGISMLSEVELTAVEGKDNQWTFTMERANVEISATYKKLLSGTDIKVDDIAALTYNGKAQTPKVTVKDGETTLVENTDYTLSYSDNTNAGTATVTITAAENSKYSGKITKTFTINKAKLTITAEAKSKVYGTTDPELTYKAEGLVEGEKLDGALTRAEGENAGEYAITQGTLKATDNYEVTFTGAKLTITKAKLTITADAQTKVAGEKDPELTYTVTGLVKGDALTGALDRKAGEAVGEYDITQGTLKASDNYEVTFVGAKLTISERTYKVVVAKTTGGEVVVSKVNGVKANEQVNMVIKPAEGYHLESLVVTTDKGANVTIRDTEDGKGNKYKSFLMPAADAIVTAVFAIDAKEGEGEQNIFIFKAKYGEVVSHVLHADEGQQVNLETRPVEGYEDCVLDELIVYNEKGETLPVNTIETKEEGLVYYFIMKGEKAFVYNTFKGTNNTVDESQPVDPDNLLYLLNNDYLSLLNLGNGTEGVQLAMTLVANILATINDNGELTVKQGQDDIIMALLNLKSGWQIQIDFTGMIKTLAPELLEGVGADGILSSGEVYTLLADTNLELLLQSSVLPLVIKSISVTAPEPEPTAISGFMADEKAADIYDLRGRKADPSHLRPGIYIKNGKKIIFK